MSNIPPISRGDRAVVIGTAAAIIAFVLVVSAALIWFDDTGPLPAPPAVRPPPDRPPVAKKCVPTPGGPQ